MPDKNKAIKAMAVAMSVSMLISSATPALAAPMGYRDPTRIVLSASEVDNTKQEQGESGSGQTPSGDSTGGNVLPPDTPSQDDGKDEGGTDNSGGADNGGGTDNGANSGGGTDSSGGTNDGSNGGADEGGDTGNEGDTGNGGNNSDEGENGGSGGDNSGSGEGDNGGSGGDNSGEGDNGGSGGDNGGSGGDNSGDNGGDNGGGSGGDNSGENGGNNGGNGGDNGGSGGDNSGEQEPGKANYIGNQSYKVKINGTNLSVAIMSRIKEVAASKGHKVAGIVLTPDAPKATQDSTIKAKITYEDKKLEEVDVSITVVSPESYEFSSSLASPIRASDKENSSENAILTYVNASNDLRPLGAEYNAALGTAPVYKATAYKWNNCDTTYRAQGNVTYTFTQDYNGVILIRKLTVSSISNSAPSVRIDYSDNTVNTTKEMQWSSDGSKWVACSDNMKITTSWYGKDIYFRYPASSYRDESPSTRLYIPNKADTPKTKLELTSTSHSVTIENCWDYDDAEYSIDDGDTWKTTNSDTYTFDKLTANTNYKVLVRTRADVGHRLASDSLSSSIKTSDTANSKLDINYDKSDRTIDVSIELDSEIKSRIYTGSLSSDNLERFQTVVNGFKKDYGSDFTVTFDVSQLTGKNESSKVDGFKATLPMSPFKTAIKYGGMVINYECDLAQIKINNSSLDYFSSKSGSGTMTIEVSEVKGKVSGSKYSWLNDEISKDRPAYKLSVKVGSYGDTGVTYKIPYKMGNNETEKGLQVYFVDSSGTKRSVSSKYTSGNIEFTTSEQGYFVITHTKETPKPVQPTIGPMNFTDVSSGDWFYSAVEYCYLRGIFEGVGNNRFNPTGILSRAEVLTLLARTDGVDTTETVSKVTHSDVKTSDWFAAAANWAGTKKLVTGKQFKPNESMTRSEIASMLYTYLNSVKRVAGNTSYKVDYTDISKVDSTAKKAIPYLASIGVMQGTGGDKFNPNGTLTRAEMATIMYRLVELVGIPVV